MPEPAPEPTPEPLSLGEPAIALDVVLQAVFHTLLMLSVYFLFVGHNAPGGGFVGGLVAGGALVLRFISGRPQFHSRISVPPLMLLGVGVVIVTAVALTSLALGNTLLEHDKLEVDLPVFGHVKATSALVFDTGIYLVVIGVISTILGVLGPEKGRVADRVPTDPTEVGS